MSGRTGALWALLLLAGAASAQARKDVPGLALSVPVPKGWTGKMQEEGGQQGFALAPLARPESGGVVVSRQPAPQLPPGTTLPQAFGMLASELTGGAPVTAVGPAEFFPVDGREAGRQLFRGETEGTQLELYVGVMMGEPTWVAVLGGWPAVEAPAMRTATDSVLRGLKVKAPAAADAGLLAKLRGCWNEVQRSTGGVGSGYREVKLQLGPDGRYSRRSVVSMSVPGLGGVSEGTESGRWVLAGDVLQLLPDDGAPSAQKASFKGGLLTLGDTRYVPCAQ